MLDAGLLLGLFVTTFSAFALMALNQERHWVAVCGRYQYTKPTGSRLSVFGYGLLIGSLPIALMRDGPAFGALMWGTVLTMVAFAVVLTLTLRPHWLLLYLRMFKAQRV